VLLQCIPMGFNAIANVIPFFFRYMFYIRYMFCIYATYIFSCYGGLYAMAFE